MASLQFQNTPTNFSYRIALMEEIKNVKNNIEKIQDRILKNEINLQNSISSTLEEYIMELRTNNLRRAKKKVLSTSNFK